MPPLAAPEITPAYKLYEWYFGEPPPADNALILIYPQVALFFTGRRVRRARPHASRSSAMACSPSRPRPSAVTQPSVDYGRGVWDEDDYAGIDDMVELWWDPDATGLDETGEDGKGMYRYVDGGKRYLPGEYTSELKVFDQEGSLSPHHRPAGGRGPARLPVAGGELTTPAGVSTSGLRPRRH